MPRLSHSVVICREPRSLFAITNDIDKWSVLFDEYNDSRIVKREDAGRFTKLTFRLKNRDGFEWQSWRLLDHDDLIAIAEREDPLFPFKYMHLKWTYEPAPDGTRMTWTQDFEIDPASGLDEAVVAARMEAHGLGNQKRIKELIESGAVDTVATPVV